MMVTNHKLSDSLIPGIYMILTIFPYITYLCIFISCGLFILTVLQTYELYYNTMNGFMQYSNTYFELIYVSIDQLTVVGDYVSLFATILKFTHVDDYFNMFFPPTHKKRN